MNKNIHSGHRARLRQTMSKVGFNNMQPHQVLEYLLSFVVARKDTNPIAHALIDHFGSFYSVVEAPVEELMKVDGIGEVAATFLSQFLHFYDYYLADKSKKIKSISNSTAAAIFATSLLGNKQTEELYAILLDSQSNVIDYHKMGSGTKSNVNVKVSDVTKYALSHNATQVIICHNHPDTDSSPSAEDLTFTDNLSNALHPNGITLAEHIIVGKSDCYSFKSEYKITQDMIKEYKKVLGL